MRKVPGEGGRERPERVLRRTTGLLLGLALIAELFLPPAAHALDPNRLITQYVHDTWGRKSGLPSPLVWSIIQSRKGYLWLGTQHGVARFDGVRFKVFTAENTPALHSNDIRSVLQSQDGSIWFGTYGGGAVRYRDGQFRAFTKKDGLADNVVYQVYQDRSGNLWFATGGGVSRLHDGHFTNLTKADGLPGNRIFQIVEGPSGAMWFGTLTGGLVRDRDGKLTTFTTKNGLGSDQIHSLFVTRKGTLIVGTYGGGLYRYHKGHFVAFDVPDKWDAQGVEVIRQDAQGNLWLGTYGGGLIRYHDGHFSRLTRGQGLTDNFVYGLCIDSQGDLWAGTRNGLDRLKNGKFLVYGKPEGMADPTFDVYQSPSGTVWVGTEGHGLYGIAHGRVTRHLTKTQGLSSNNVSGLAGTGHGGLWIGTFGGGLDRLKNGKVTTLTKADGLAGNFIDSLLRTPDDSLWVGTENGLTRLVHGHAAKTLTKANGLPDSLVRVIYRDRSGNLWFGTNGGGLVRDSGGRLHTFSVADGLPSDLVYALYQGPHGNLWIGTRGGGLSLYRKDRFFNFGTQQGIPARSIYGILEDGRGNLWMSTPAELLRVPLKQLLAVADGTRSRVHVTRFDESDGMRSSQFAGGFEPSAWQARNGTLWFPSTHGVVVADPGKLQRSDFQPPVYIESVRADGKTLDLSHQPVVLPPHVRNLEVHYTALSLAAPNQVRFRYRLEGLDNAWVSAGNRRTAYYTHLPAGHFDFHVVAANRDGVWNGKAAGFSFVREPFFYQTWWFLTLLGTLGALVLFGGYRMRVRHLRRRQRGLSRLVSQRTRQLQEALDKVERLSRVDPLTGVANRRALEEGLRREWGRAKRSRAPLSLLMVDIDRFKDLNDKYGHQHGDECLQAVATALNDAARRSTDLAGRWGGEEFLVLLPDTGAIAARTVAERLRRRIEEQRIEHRDGGTGEVVTVSVGVATYSQDAEIPSHEALVAAADQAMYRAKHGGRNRVAGPAPQQG